MKKLTKKAKGKENNANLSPKKRNILEVHKMALREIK